MHKNVERNKLILEMRMSGKTLREIGTEFGITRERIRQICGFIPRNSSADSRLYYANTRLNKTEIDNLQDISDFFGINKSKALRYAISIVASVVQDQL